MSTAAVDRVLLASSAVALVALALWMGGMVTLGAVVAPVIFGNVPAPTSADAMTLVFQRFDRVAMTCAVVVLLAEIPRPLRGVALGRSDVARAAIALVAAALAIWQGTSISPRIAGLHRMGAIRGLGELGLELQQTHRLAELGGKAQAVLGVGLIVLHLVGVTRRVARQSRGDPFA